MEVSIKKGGFVTVLHQFTGLVTTEFKNWEELNNSIPLGSNWLRQQNPPIKESELNVKWYQISVPLYGLDMYQPETRTFPAIHLMN